MQIANFKLSTKNQLEKVSGQLDQDADIVFAFGDTDTIKQLAIFEMLKQNFPNSHIVGASSSGNIMANELQQETLVVTAIKFDSSKAILHSIDIDKSKSTAETARELVEMFDTTGLKHLFLLSDGLTVNGSELVHGANSALSGISITGGLAGDGARFENTFVVADAPARESIIAAIGFYGDKLSISSGCFGGWSEFGVERTITKSKANVLYEIDNEPALDFYKRYLGTYAAELPSSGLRFPLSIKKDKNDPEVIRTLLAIDEDAKSITFAGDVPEGFRAKLMKPDIDKLIDGAATAAKEIVIANNKPALGLVVSCVGRKIVLGGLIDEELQSVADTLGANVNLIGFYSYGEIAPFVKDKLKCELHNQTMTLTAIYEE